MSLSVVLTPQLEGVVKQKIAGGLYHSATEVVCEALRLLDEYDGVRTAKLEKLRKDIAVGLNEVKQGKGTPLDMKSIITRCNKMYKNRE